MTTCDFCSNAAVWLLVTSSPDGAGMTSVACQADVDIARALLARIAPPCVTPLESNLIPEG